MASLPTPRYRPNLPLSRTRPSILPDRTNNSVQNTFFSHILADFLYFGLNVLWYLMNLSDLIWRSLLCTAFLGSKHWRSPGLRLFQVGPIRRWEEGYSFYLKYFGSFSFETPHLFENHGLPTWHNKRSVPKYNIEWYPGISNLPG